MNTRVPWGRHTTAKQSKATTKFSEQKPYISNLIFGTVARRPLYTITVPVLEDELHFSFT